MSSLTLLQSLHESLSTRAQVTSVFGEPIVAGDKTIIPVAKIAYGFGGGTGSGGLEIKTARGEGGGRRRRCRSYSRGRFRGRSAGNSLRRGGRQEEAAGHVVAGRGAGFALRAAQEKVEVAYGGRASPPVPQRRRAGRPSSKVNVTLAYLHQQAGDVIVLRGRAHETIHVAHHATQHFVRSAGCACVQHLQQARFAILLFALIQGFRPGRR